MDESTDAADLSYGSLLGELFSVTSAIGDLETRLGSSELDEHEEYSRLLDRRRRLREELDRVPRNGGGSEIEDLLDEAFADE